MEHPATRDAARTVARLLRLALMAYLITAIPRPRLGDLALEGAWLTVLISLLLAALTVVGLCLGALAEFIRDWRDGRL
jgi:hypothetical protein